jgi:DNA polymerase-3 subunit epsilon
MAKLALRNPIVFLDLETTGVDAAKDRIIEISLVKVMPDGSREVKTRRLNPGIPIPPEATAVHHITDQDVKDCPSFREVAKSLAAWIEGADLAGFNSNKFDIPLLAEEFLRAGVDVDLKKRKAVDVQNIFHKLEPRTLTAAYKFYCGKDLEGAHGAEADTLATLEVLEGQLDKYPDELKNDIAFLADFSTRDTCADYAGRIVYDDKGREVFSFGKHRGRAVSEVFRDEPSYYSWMMNGDFPEYTKKVITEIKLRDAAALK